MIALIKRKFIKEMFKNPLEGEGAITTTRILANAIKVQAISKTGRMKLI